MLKKYLKIHRIFINNGFSWLAQYRSDTWFNFLMHIAYLGMLFLIVEIIFGQTNSLAGWSKSEVYVMTLIWGIVEEFYVVFFRANLNKISNLVTDGELDLLLTKPVSSLFMVSTSLFLARGVYRLFFTIGFFVFVIIKFKIALSITSVLLGALMMILGVAVIYSVNLFFNSLSFWLYRIDNVNDAIGSLVTLGRYPLNVFPKLVKVLFLTFLPIGFIAYIPSVIIFAKWPALLILMSIFGALLIFSLSVKFWHFAVKRYSSASS